MRRGTLITLICLFALLVTIAVIQLTQTPPESPYPGPASGTPLPSGVTTGSGTSPPAG
jgi:hypothetical protein